MFRTPADFTAIIQTQKYSRGDSFAAIANKGKHILFGPLMPNLLSKDAAPPACISIGHREQQNAVVRLIHDHSKIGELVDGHTELRRVGEGKRVPGFQRT